VATQGVYGGRPLTHQVVSHSMQSHRGLLFHRLCRHKAHAWALDRFTTSLRVSRIVLVRLHIRAHELRRHQTNVVA
jgi:hypothetical protein